MIGWRCGAPSITFCVRPRLAHDTAFVVDEVIHEDSSEATEVEGPAELAAGGRTMTERTAALLLELRACGESLPSPLRERIVAEGAPIIPPLLDVLLEDEDDEGGEDDDADGWASIHAVDLLVELKAEAAVGPMLHVLAETDWDYITHDRIVLRLHELGAPVLEPALSMLAEAPPDDVAESLCAIVSQLGIRDERVFHHLVARFPENAVMASGRLADYGDQRGVPLIEREILDFVVDGAESYDLLWLRDLTEAYERLAGPSPPISETTSMSSPPSGRRLAPMCHSRQRTRPRLGETTRAPAARKGNTSAATWAATPSNSVRSSGMKARFLLVSFWDVGLPNFPIGHFSHRQVSPRQAKRLIDSARRAKSLAGVSGDDLFAPYHRDKAIDHEKLRRALAKHHGISLTLEDFVIRDDESSSVRPLVIFQIGGGDRLLVVDCSYTMPKLRRKGPLRFVIAPDRIPFHLFEVTERPRIRSASKRLNRTGKMKSRPSPD